MNASIFTRSHGRSSLSGIVALSFSAIVLGGCSSSDDGPNGGAGSGAAPAGAAGTGAGAAGTTNGGVAGAPVAGAATGGRGGASAGAGGIPGTGGTPGLAGAGPSTAGSGGVVSGGASNGGASGGTFGAAGSAGSSGSGPQGGSSAGGPSTGGGSGAGCPSNATFCSGFEDSGLPMGAVYKLNGDPATPWTHDFEIDTTVHNSGNSALRVKTNTESSGAYKMLAVPAPGAAFWVRFYIRSDVDLGASDHNVYAMAAGSDEPNDNNNVEFAEDVGLAFNSHDDVRWPMNYGRLSGGGTMPFTLPKDTWHCIEISFDGQGKAQQLFIEGMQRINATGFPSQAYAFKNFKFGYNALHGTVRKTWYDDVVVAPARANCP